jgi:hypothetical protein
VNDVRMSRAREIAVLEGLGAQLDATRDRLRAEARELFADPPDEVDTARELVRLDRLRRFLADRQELGRDVATLAACEEHACLAHELPARIALAARLRTRFSELPS